MKNNNSSAGSAVKRFITKVFLFFAALALTFAVYTVTFLPPYFGVGAPKLPQGDIVILDSSSKISVTVNGTAAKYTGSEPEEGYIAAPRVGFNEEGIVLVAKAIEELTTSYRALSDYGSVYSRDYRIFVMKVIDPLESGMIEDFYYALPAELSGDLMKYDFLLLTMDHMGNDYVLEDAERGLLTSFNMLFDSYESPELGNIIPFTNGIFDETLWQNEGWDFGYQFIGPILDAGEASDLLVTRDSPIGDAITRLYGKWEEKKAAYAARGEVYLPRMPKDLDYEFAEAREAAEFVKPFENGVFIANNSSPNSTRMQYRRYIGGCPTNEYIIIDTNTEAVRYSEMRFDDEDFKALPDIAAYIGSIDLSSVQPQNTDTDGKKLLFNSANGWYEKTESGVYAIVKISWLYVEENDSFIRYMDESFILLEKERARLISREELIALIGENRNIYTGEYGKRIVNQY